MNKHKGEQFLVELGLQGKTASEIQKKIRCIGGKYK